MAKESKEDSVNDVVLSKEEMDQVRNIIKSNTEKDKQIAELTRKVEELSHKEDEPVEDTTREVGTKGTMKKTPDGDWVVGFTRRPNGRAIYKEVNPGNQNEYLEFIDLIVLGKDKPVKTLYKAFSEDFQSEEVTLVRKNKKPTKILHDGGTVLNMQYDSTEGDMKETGRKVRAVVVNDADFVFTVNLDGKEVDVDQQFINM